MTQRRAKILCTLGPATRSPEGIAGLLDAGANAIRLNFSHGSHEEHRATLEMVREQSSLRGKAVTILADLQGPKIRVGKIPDPGMVLSKGSMLILSVDPSAESDISGKPFRTSIDLPTLAREAEVGDRVLMDDGALEAVIREISGSELHLEMLNGGVLTSRKGVNLPGTNLSLPSLTDKDIADLRFALEIGADMVALSFVRSASDLENAKEIMRKAGKVVPLVAKIEKPQAVRNLESIVEVADGLMIARGDLGVEMGPEEVPIVQKRAIHLCNAKGKLVITATQMLDSMIRNPRPTRAEASDVANAVLDGSDALMLSGETAVGAFPFSSVETMHRIISRTERSEPYLDSEPIPDMDLGHAPNAIARAAVACSASLHDTQAIVVYTGSGGSARLISDYRPQVPILAFTPDASTYHALAIYWGVEPQLFSPSTPGGENIFIDLDRALIERGLVARDGRVIMAMGYPLKARASANLIKLHTVGESLQSPSRL